MANDLIKEDWLLGTAAAVVDSSNSSVFSTSGLDPVFGNTHPEQGLFDVVCTGDATNQSSVRFNFTSSGLGKFSVMLHIDALPAATQGIMSWFNGTTKIGDIRVNASGTIQIRDNSTSIGTTTSAITAGQDFRIELEVDPNVATTGHILRLFVGANRYGATPAAGDTVSGNATASAQTVLDNLRIGSVAAGVMTVHIDSVRGSATTIPDPRPVVVKDSFTRTSSTVLGSPDIGSAWAAQSGTWGTDGASGKLVSTANGTYVNVTPSGGPNVLLRVKLNLSATRSGIAPIILSDSTGANYWYVSCEASSLVNNITVGHVDAGVDTTYFTRSGFLTIGGSHWLTVSVTTGYFEVKLDGVLIHQITLTGPQTAAAATRTHVGMRYRVASSVDDGTSTFDDYDIQTLTGAHQVATQVGTVIVWTNASQSTASLTSALLSLPQTATAGNALLVQVAADSTPTISGYTLLGSSVSTAGVWLFGKVAAGGETTVQATFSTSTISMIAAVEYAGLTLTVLDTATDSRTAVGSGTLTAGPIAAENVFLISVTGWRATGITFTLDHPTGGFDQGVGNSTDASSGHMLYLDASTRNGTFDDVYLDVVEPDGPASGEIVLVALEPDATNTTVTPGVISTTAAIATPTVVAQRDQTVSPAVVTTTTTVPAPTVIVPDVTIVQPSTIQTTTTTAVLGDVQITSRVDPTEIATTTEIDVPTQVGGEPITVVTPAAIDTTTGIAAPTVVVGQSAFIDVQPISTTTRMDPPDLEAGFSTDVAVDPIQTTTGISDPAVSGAASVTVQPDAIETTTSIPQPTIVISAAPFYRFQTPVRIERYFVARPGLMGSRRIGITVIKEGGAFRQVVGPSQYELDAADAYWIGGLLHTVTREQADELTNAGYGDGISVLQGAE